MFDQNVTYTFGVSINIYIDDSNIAIGGRRLCYPPYVRRGPVWIYDTTALVSIIARAFGFDGTDPNIKKDVS
ncbi:hypothetical protein ACLX1H_009037 [Fusarium chlamydosporum]